MIAAAGDTNVDPYTGAERFAGGGVARFSGGGSPDSYPYAEVTEYINNAKSSSTGMRQLTADVANNKPSALMAYNLLKQEQKIQPQMSQAQNSANVQNPTTAQQASITQSGLAMAVGGIAGAPNLGSYATGGNPRLLKGPGDGMSDNIPATIGGHQPARLADGEFVVPADVVSHLGNGSTDAGANKLHSMMDKVRKARTGTKKQGKQIKADKFVPK
jgi:hypothetical protein